MTVAVVRKMLNSAGDSLGHHLLLWCPGCNQLHGVDFTGPDGVKPKVEWTFDGNLDAPTVSPSLLCRWPAGEDQTEQVCHSFIVAGQWQFLADCTHALAGQTVPLPDLPAWVVGR